MLIPFSFLSILLQSQATTKTSIKLTQDSYGKIVEKKISDEMERLRDIAK
jgi:hypothetical protein